MNDFPRDILLVSGRDINPASLTPELAVNHSSKKKGLIIIGL